MMSEGVAGQLFGIGVRVGHVTKITPYKVAVIILIDNYAKYRPKYWEPLVPQDIPVTFPAPTVRQRKSAALLAVKLIQSPDLSLCSLLQAIEVANLPTDLFSSVIDAMKNIYCQGIDSLLSLFDSVDKFTSPEVSRMECFPCLWTSVVGLYMRVLGLRFRQLGFSRVAELYENFKLYYKQLEGHPFLASSYMTGNVFSCDPCKVLDEVMDEMQDDDGGSIHSTEFDDMSSNSVNAITQLTSLVQGTKIGKDPFAGQQAEIFISHQVALLQFNQAAALSPPEMQQRIVQLMQKHGVNSESHYLSYLNCLRSREYCGAMSSLTSTYDYSTHLSASRGEDSKLSFRYAALNLAILHAQFGHRELSLSALRESVRLAQESCDHVCLQNALAWMYFILPNPYKTTLISHSMVKSSELTLSYLSSLSRLNLVGQLVQVGLSPAMLLETLMRADAVNCQHSLVPLQHGTWALRGALWTAWGFPYMVSLCSQLQLNLNTHLHTSPTVYFCNQATVAGICNLALTMSEMGEHQHASSILQHAEKRCNFPSHFAATWRVTRLRIAYSDLLKKGKWTQAENVITAMASTQPVLSKLGLCELRILQGDFHSALQLLIELGKDDTLDQDIRVRLLLLEAAAVVAGGSGSSAALPLLVTAVELCRKGHLTYLAALAQLQLGSVQLGLGLLAEAAASVHAGLPVVLAGTSVYDQARGRLIAAKIQVATAHGDNRANQLVSVAKSLELICQLFTKVQSSHRVKETYYLQARLYHEIGYLEERNKSALQFRNLELQYPCSSMQHLIF